MPLPADTGSRVNFNLRPKLPANTPCCSSGAAAPAIVSGDDLAQISLGISRGSVIGDAPDQGIPIFRAPTNSEITQTLRVDSALMLSDRFQCGLGVPLIQRSVRDTKSSTHATRLGDIALTLAHETLPEWSYSQWKPKGITFAQLTLPTGKSIYDSQTISPVEMTGKGFYSVAFGEIFTKTFRRFDIFLIPEIHYSLTRTFEAYALENSITVSPRFGGSLAFGMAYSPASSDFRFGLRIQPTYNEGKIIQSETGSRVARHQQSCDIGVDVAYWVNSNWSALLAYTDQTLLGPAVNTNLSRTVSLGLQHRWER